MARLCGDAKCALLAHARRQESGMEYTVAIRMRLEAQSFSEVLNRASRYTRRVPRSTCEAEIVEMKRKGFDLNFWNLYCTLLELSDKDPSWIPLRDKVATTPFGEHESLMQHVTSMPAYKIARSKLRLLGWSP